MLANASYAGLALSLMMPYTLMLAYAMMRACKEERASRRTVMWLIPVCLLNVEFNCSGAGHLHAKSRINVHTNFELDGHLWKCPLPRLGYEGDVVT